MIVFFELCYSYLTPSEHAKDEVFQLTFTCSKLTIETQEKGMKYVQSQQQKHQNDVNAVVFFFLLLTLNIIQTFF